MLFFVAYLGALVISEATATAQTWFLGYWASQYTIEPPIEVPVIRYALFTITIPSPHRSNLFYSIVILAFTVRLLVS